MHDKNKKIVAAESGTYAMYLNISEKKNAQGGRKRGYQKGSAAAT